MLSGGQCNTFSTVMFIIMAILAAIALASGSFDTKLAVVAVSTLAGIVLLSFLIDWLSFLPGIVELLLWAGVGLMVIWQLKRRAAGTDPGELATAEAWNPAVVARTVVAAVRRPFEIHRAQRREAERAQAAAGPVTPQFTGDDGMVHTGSPRPVNSLRPPTRRPAQSYKPQGDHHDLRTATAIRRTTGRTGAAGSAPVRRVPPGRRFQVLQEVRHILGPCQPE